MTNDKNMRMTLDILSYKKRGTFSAFAIIDDTPPLHIEFDYDFDGVTPSGDADIRSWWLFADTILDAAKTAGAIIDYNMETGKVSVFKAPDDYKDVSMLEWLEWFVTDGDPRVVQPVFKNACKAAILDRQEALDSIDHF